MKTPFLYAALLFACFVACSDSPRPPSPLAASPETHARGGFHETDAGFTLRSGASRVLVDRAARIHASSFALETVALGRGTPAALDTTTARLESDGTVTAGRTSSGAVERVTAHPLGLEQRWEFGAPPAGKGDLVVRVHPSGGVFDGATDAGLRFADAKRSVFYRYEQAAWVDAAGARTPLRVQLGATGDIELTVPADLVDRSAYPAVLDPILGVEFELENPIFIPSPNTGNPNVASDGTNYLVTWAATGGVYAARVSAAGVVQAPQRTTVSSTGSSPRAVWDGTEWLVAWINSGSVYYARVASNGTLMDTTPQGIASTSAQSVDVASDGHHVFVVFDESTTTYITQTFGVLVTPGMAAGTPQGLSTAAYSQKTPRVVYDGIEYFVAWADSRGSPNQYQQTWDIYGARVSTGGVLVDVSGIAISTATADQLQPCVTAGGGYAFISWVDYRAGTAPWRLYGARFASAVGLVDGPAATGGILIDSNSDFYPSVAFDGQQFVVNWWSVSNADVYTVSTELVSTAGAVVGSPQVIYTVSASFYKNSTVGGSTNGSLAVIMKADEILYGNRLNQAGQLLDGPSPTGGFPVSYEFSTKSSGALGFNGTNYLAVWSDDRDGSNVGAIYGTRLDAGGTVLDAPAFAIATERAQGAGVLAVASNGTGWAVSWTEGTKLFVRLLNADGSLVNGPSGADGVPLSVTGYGAILASDGIDYLAVWSDTRGSTSSNSYTNVYGLRFTQAAQVVPATGSTDGSFPVATGNDEFAEGLAFDGTNYLLAWDDNTHPNSGGSRLTTAGARMDGTVGTAGFAIPATTNSDVGLAWNGSAYLAASSQDIDIVVPPNGSVAQTASPLTVTRSVVYDGASFWAFDNNGKGTRFRDDATAVDSTLVADMSSNYYLPSATDKLGDLLVMYPVGTDARARIIIDDSPNGTSCATGTYCASGVCEDGVCCDKACGGSTTDCRACTKVAGGTKDGVCTVSAMGFTCRPGDACELPGKCDGVTTTCPAPYYLPPNTVCGAAGACAAAPLCAGTSDTCNPGLPVMDGTPCDDAGVCASGVCKLPFVDAGLEGGGAEAGVGLDAGSVEAGQDGAAVSDAGAAESGSEGGADAGSGVDGGTVADSGSKPGSDAGGASDAAGSADTGSSPDASGDATATSDSGGGEPPGDSGSEASAGAGGNGSSGGCGCRAAGSEPAQGGWLALFGAVGLLGIARRRESTRPRALRAHRATTSCRRTG